MNLTSNFFDTIRNRVDIAVLVSRYVELKRKSGEYIGLCPFHQEKSPSFTVTPLKRFYHCFGCKASGDVIKFFAEVNSTSYRDAAIKIAQDNGIPLPQVERGNYDEIEGIRRVLEMACKYFQQNPKTILAKEYMLSRGLSEELVSKFEIGFAQGDGSIIKHMEANKIPLALIHQAGLIAKDDKGCIYEVFRKRVIFPIRNLYNEIVGFGGRALSNVARPKYLNSPETKLFKKQETLYAENFGISASYKPQLCILVEGYMDCVTMHKMGFQNTLATLGTSVTAKHLEKVWSRIPEIVICLDGDIAGMTAVKRVIDIAIPKISSSHQVSFVLMKQGLDPDSFFEKCNADDFQELIDKRISFSNMLWHVNSYNKRLDNIEKISALESQLKRLCSNIQDDILRKNYIDFMRRKCWQISTKCDPKDTIARSRIVNTTKDLSRVDLSARDNIEYSLCSLLLCNLSMLENDEIFKDFESTKFANMTLHELRSHVVFLVNKGLRGQEIERKIKEAGLQSLNVLLSKFGRFFAGDTTGKSSAYLKSLWDFLLQKRKLIELQEHYGRIITLRGKDDDESRLCADEVREVQRSISTIAKQIEY